jgi:predicted RNase H-like HicB family nuclease
MPVATHTSILKLPALELAQQYLFSVSWSWEHEAYVAVAPDWPALEAQGPTVKDAVNELRLLMAHAIEESRLEGSPLPPPKTSTSSQLGANA